MDLVAALAVLVGVVAQAVSGFGFSLVCAPLLLAAYGAPEGVQLNFLASVVVNVVLLTSARRHVQWASAGQLLGPAAATAVGLGLLVRGSDSPALTVVAGCVCLIGVLAVARGRPIRRLAGTTGAVVIGAVSGATTVTAGIGGPPVVLFGLNARWPAAEGRATLQAYFLGLNLITLATLGLPEEVPWLVPAGLVLGLLAARPVVRRVRPEQVRRSALVIAGVGSILAIARGVAG